MKLKHIGRSQRFEISYRSICQRLVPKLIEDTQKAGLSNLNCFDMVKAYCTENFLSSDDAVEERGEMRGEIWF